MVSVLSSEPLVGDMSSQALALPFRVVQFTGVAASLLNYSYVQAR